MSKTYTIREFAAAWVEYIHEVEADSPEEALEKVENGETYPTGPGELGESVEGTNSEYHVLD